MLSDFLRPYNNDLCYVPYKPYVYFSDYLIMSGCFIMANLMTCRGPVHKVLASHTQGCEFKSGHGMEELGRSSFTTASSHPGLRCNGYLAIGRDGYCGVLYLKSTKTAEFLMYAEKDSCLNRATKGVNCELN